MKTTSYLLIAAVSLAAIVQTASADVLLSDDFSVSANTNNLNLDIASGRQTGTRAITLYTGWSGNYQVGNTTTDVGQPGGAANGNFVLLANDGRFFSDLNIASVATGPLTVEFDMYMTGSNNPSTDTTTWGSCTLRASGTTFPVAGAGEFGFLQRVNGGMQVFNNGGNIAPGSWDTVGFATNTHWKVTFSDMNGTGSAFTGNGSQATFVNGANTLGTVALGQLNSAGLRLGFSDNGNRYVGVDNLSISGMPASFTPAGQNLSFEYDTTLTGQAVQFVPTSWTAFNRGAISDFGSQNPSSGMYPVISPLAAPADGTNFCYINTFNGNTNGGIYQDKGPLQPNTVYTLTVAIGHRADFNNSAGVISLVNGTNNAGTLLATGGGLPALSGAWQDYSTSFSTGPSVSGDVTVVLSVVGNSTTIQGDFDNVRLTAVQSPIPLPVLITNTTPASATVAVGSNVVFTAAFSNSPPVSLQWQEIAGGVTNNINTGVVTVTNNGIVSSTLTLNNVQVADAGSYRLEAANATNFVTIVDSASAPLTVISTIIWHAAGTYNSTFSDNSVLALAGSVADEVYGINFGVGPATTDNGYSFDDYLDSGNMSIAGSVSAFTGYLGSVSTGDNNLDVILNNGVHGTSANVGTLKNLTVGQDYTVLVLLNDTRTSGAGGPNFQVTDGLTTSPSQRYAFPDGSPAIGGFIMGTFTAQSTNQPLTVLRSASESQYIAILVEKGIAPAPPIQPALTTDLVPPLWKVTTGGPVTMSVAAAGFLPLSYRWFNQSGVIAGATSTNYTFNAVTGTNSYYVIITNSYGSVTSSIAVVISSTNIVTVNNFSFEADPANNGGGVRVPTSWTGFNNNNFSGTVDGNYPTIPDGTNYFAINEGPGDPTGGIYQDVGALLANTTYTLTVATGHRGDFAPDFGSPGIISLINGTDNTGMLLNSTNGYPATPGDWEDLVITFTTGTAVSGDLTVALSVAPANTYQANFDNVRLTKVAAIVPTPPMFGAPYVSGGNLILTGTGGTPNAAYTWLTTTNLSAPINWTTNSTGTLDGTGAFSNAIPITATPPASFFRMRLP